MFTLGPSTVASPIAQAPAGRRRPRDRKQQILTAAAEQFWALGYHQVAMADIAAAVGIGASALYRHYRSKQDLLLEVLNEALDRLDPAPDGPEDLDDLIGRIGTLGLDRRQFGALYNRERGHLPPADREALTGRLRAVVSRTAAALATSRPAEPGETTDLRARAVLAVLHSPSYHRVPIEGGRAELLHRAAQAVTTADLPRGDQHAPARWLGGADPQAPVTRREALLAAAVQLFAGRGFPAVSLTDIGAATGMAGPSVYTWFTSKHELLISGLNRGNEALWLGLHHALADADGPLDALHRTLGSYIGFAAANPDIVSVMLAETVHLPAEQREHYRTLQHEYVAEQVALLCRSRRDLDEAQARVLVNAALALPNSLMRVPRLRRRALLADEVSALARAVLQVPSRPT